MATQSPHNFTRADNGTSLELSSELTGGLIVPKITITTDAGTGTIRLGAGSAIPTSTAGADEGAPSESSVNKVMRVTMDFDQTTQQYCQWRFSMPHDYNGGTITGKVKWGSAGAGNAIYGIQGVCIADGEALDAAFGTAKEVTDTLIAAADLQVTAATAAITLAGTPAADILTNIQLYRKAAATGDTLTADALVDEVLLTYTKALN